MMKVTFSAGSGIKFLQNLAENEKNFIFNCLKKKWMIYKMK